MRASHAPGRVLILGLLLSLTPLVTAAQAPARPLFVEPLHLTRQLSDPISGTTSTLDEYCHGDRVVSIRDSRASIADYAKSTLTEIDHAKGTYSVTSFDAIARALPDASGASARTSATAQRPELTDVGVRPVGNRGGRAFQARIADPQGSRTIDVVVDQQLKLTREAVEVLVGAAFPLRRSIEGDVAIAAAGRDRAAGKSGSGLAGDHALPLEQTVTWEIDGETLRIENRIVRVGNELPPPDLIAIPPGAQLVESDIVLRKTMLEELDRLPSAAPSVAP
ncbi:MAG: hypothetical protein HYU52_15540 [Acidobacteria bacterium]|nr:hypothetical protein [Acidobacteriota bacterium]